jgi:hypothetical protein
MNTPITHDPRYLLWQRAQTAHDVLLVSSFALWAMLIGVAPVMAFRLLMS